MTVRTFSFKGRIRFIYFFIILFCLLIIVRLYFLQIVNGTGYSDKADRQYTSISVNTFDRGNIYFQDKLGGLISAADLNTGYVLGINPKSIEGDPEDYYKKISKIIELDTQNFYAKASNKDSSYGEIARRITENQIKKINDLKLAGLIVSKEKWRNYPGNTLAANTIGFVGFDDSGINLVGRYGFEKYYQDTLTRNGNSLYVNTFAEIFTNIGKTISNSSQNEGDIVSSINPEVQSYAEKQITSVNNTWSSRSSGAIIVDPNTGEIYAMASVPTFDLNNFKKEKNVSVFSNPLVSDAYEMGSIVKALTMAAGLDAGAVTAKTTYNDTGTIEIDGKTISNFDKKARGITDMQVVLNNSLNLGAAFVADRLGKDDFLKYFKSFGFGTETGIDLPAEARGNISNLTNNLKNSKKIEFANASFGQGISLTPIMTVRALSSLANGGKIITPHVVKKINYKIGLVKNISYVDEAKQVIKKETSEEISRMLVNVVDVALLNGTAKMKNYSIAAKTGTAQMARPANEGGGYYPDKVLHSFFGYFPAYKPKFLILLYTIDPKGAEFASKTLTQPFFNITKYLINYYAILPDR